MEQFRKYSWGFYGGEQPIRNGGVGLLMNEKKKKRAQKLL